MRSKGYYTIIGFMVVALTVIGIALGIMLEFGGSDQNYKLYQIFFTDPVDDLSQQAPVKLNGVDVGFVNSIHIDKDDIAKVRVVVDIRRDVPIMDTTVARLTPQGITGLEYISLRVKEDSHTPITAPQGEMPTIPSGSSLIHNLAEQANEIGKDIRAATERFAQIINDKNVLHISRTLDNLDQATTQFRRQVMPKLSTALSNFNSMVPSFTTGMEQLQQFMQHAQKLVDSLQRNPSVLIRGTQPLPPGPGETP